MLDSWSLARGEKVEAWWAKGLLVLKATGKKPTPCHKVEFDQSVLTVEPPRFALRWRQEGVCTEQIAPYTIVNLFKIGVYRDRMLVDTADGENQRIEVKKIA